MEATIYNIEGQQTGKVITLADEVFALEQPNDHAIYMDVRQMQANARQGTHKSKERNEISGSNKKPYRQKGTGNARAGHKRSPLRRHGGRVFGPEPRDYSFRLNKKIKQLARKSALTYKARESAIVVVEDFNFSEPKTKSFVKLLNDFSIANTKVLLVLSEHAPNVYLSGRNLPNAQVKPAAELNTIDILNADKLLIQEGAVNQIHQQFAN